MESAVRTKSVTTDLKQKMKIMITQQ